VVPVASTLNKAEFSDFLEKYCHLNLKLVKDLTSNVMQCCDAIITASGTATLVIALMGIPNCITYRIAPLSYAILKRMVKIDNIGLVNIVAEKDIVKDFIQKPAQPQLIADEIYKILSDETYRSNMTNELSKGREKLGKTGGAKNVAELALEMLNSYATKAHDKYYYRLELIEINSIDRD